MKRAVTPCTLVDFLMSTQATTQQDIFKIKIASFNIVVVETVLLDGPDTFVLKLIIIDSEINGKILLSLH